jgi:hypothetical protein
MFSVCSTFNSGSLLKNVEPEFRAEKISDKPKLRDILQTNWPVFFYSWDSVIGRLLLPLHKCSCPNPGAQHIKFICRCGIVDLESVMLDGMIILNYAWGQTLTRQSFLPCQTVKCKKRENHRDTKFEETWWHASELRCQAQGYGRHWELKTVPSSVLGLKDWILASTWMNCKVVSFQGLWVNFRLTNFLHFAFVKLKQKNQGRQLACKTARKKLALIQH